MPLRFTGLLPLLKSIHKPTHLRNFSGQTLGIDAYGWLHRGTVACAIELAQGLPSRKWLDFTLNRVRMLIHFGVKPYMVFDGDYLPSKAHTEKDRAARRKESKRVGLELLRAGKTSQAHLELQKAVDVTPLMARELIEELKVLAVPYVVAPYEADSQLTYLEREGLINGVISEDSDLLVFGVKSLLTKLDQYGECVQIRRDDFTSCREISLVGWQLREFRMMAMLSGCDYLPGIEKMGLKTAYRHVRKHKVIERVVRTVQFDGKMKVPPEYLEAFTRAEQTFLYQWVFCPTEQKLVTLNKVPAELDITAMPYVGVESDPEVACGVATGQLDPNTKIPMKFISKPPLSARRSLSAQTPNEKPSKPITDFFDKPRRTPLAELDPNSFTPSPSQRRLLNDQGTSSWSASQAPDFRPPVVTRTVSTPAAPHSAPQPLRRTISARPTDPTAGASPKRQRLCSSSDIIPSTAAQGVSARAADSTSRFFGKTPTLRKTSSTAKKDEFDLWSDDSAADAIAALADTPVQPKATPKKRKLQVFPDHEESATDTPSEAISRNTSRATTLSFTTATSQSTQGIETPLTSFESRDTPNIFTKGVAQSFETLKEKWSYKPGEEPGKTGTRRTKSAPFPSVVKKSSSPIVDHVGGAAVVDAIEGTEDFVPASSPPAALDHDADESLDARADGNDDLLDDEEWLAIEHEAVGGCKGSEDLLVPESPCSDRGEVGRTSSLDLGRFAFAG